MWETDRVILGDKVRIRAICEEDAPLIVRWRNCPSVRNNLYTQTELTVEQHLAWYRDKVLRGSCAQFIIVVNPGDRPIGTVFLKEIDQHSHKAEYGIFIGEEDARSKGYGTEACRLMVRFGFETLGLNRIYLTVFSDNLRGIGSYRKVGFQIEGVLCQDYLRADGYADVTVMGLMRREWEKANAANSDKASNRVDL